MRVVKCRFMDKLDCIGSIDIRSVGEEIVFEADDETLIVFETDPKVRVVCSGAGYQFHQWGSSSYQLWLFKKGSNVCFLLSNVSFVELIDRAILVKSMNEEISIDSATLSYVKSIASKLDLIILLSRSVREDFCFKNITSYSSLNKVSECLEKAV